jgi:hypothetical protein
MRRIHLSLLIGALLALPVAVLAADDSRPVTSATVKQDAKAAGVAIKRGAKNFGVAVKHTAVKIGHAAKDFGVKVAAATKQGAHDVNTQPKDWRRFLRLNYSSEVEELMRGPWRKELESGACKSIAQIATREKANETYVNKLLQLTFLAPSLIDAIVEGRQTERLSLSSIRKVSLPIDWSKQRRLLA